MYNTSNVILRKSYSFALEIIKLYSRLTDKKEYVLSKQLLRSGTSIGANVHESISAQSKKDFIINWKSHKKKRGKHNIGSTYY
jgi:four helix bundle protein